MLAAQLRKVAVQGTQEVKSFRKNWDSEGFRLIRERANSASYPQGDDSWRTNYGSLTRQLAEPTNKSLSEGPEFTTEVNVEAESVEEVITGFQQAHPEVRVTVPPSHSGFLMDVVTGTTNFRIFGSRVAGKADYSTSAKPGKEISATSKQILQFIQTRRPERKLSILLSLLASYTNIMIQSCDKCNQIYDAKLQLPIIKRNQGVDQNTKATWSSFHRGCV